MTNKKLTVYVRNYTQYFVIVYKGKESGKEWGICTYLNYTVVHMKLTQKQ